MHKNHYLVAVNYKVFLVFKFHLILTSILQIQRLVVLYVSVVLSGDSFCSGYANMPHRVIFAKFPISKNDPMYSI